MPNGAPAAITGFHHRFCIAGRHGEFISQFARKADAEEATRNTGDLRPRHGHERQGLIGNIDRNKLRSTSRAHWPGQRKLRPVIRHIDDGKIKFGPDSACLEVEMLQHCGGIGGRAR